MNNFIFNIQSLYIIFLKKLGKIFYKHKRYLMSSKPEYNLFEKFELDEKNDSYIYFKKYFYKSIFIEDDKIREYSIKKSIELNDYDKKNTKDLYFLEFGVYKGISINTFSKFVHNIHGFDSFEGLTEDWKGFYREKGSFNLNGKIPSMKKNVTIHKGLVQETLNDFLKKENPKICFVHMDLDTYESSKFVLENIKPYMLNNSVILFDELYNYSGWKNGEHMALTETFEEDSYEYIAFSKTGKRACIKCIS
jgi:hypothetical protein